MREAILLVNAAARPAILAIYDDRGALLESRVLDGHLSEVLARNVALIAARYKIAKVLYAKGPGSFMGIKLSYIFLKSFAIAKDIEFLAADSFYFSGGEPILAHKNKYFARLENGEIALVEREISEARAIASEPSAAPIALDFSQFSAETAPNYILGAV
ncbi:MAG: hypothetical protein LBU73_08330 [Helicobacteraceae bacterium]|nr:hypothetical protein [Helicobacteraceae bacterium]